MELTKYLSEKILEIASQRGIDVIVAWGDQCAHSKQQSVSDLNSSQEEADTKIILHACDATNKGSTEVFIHSPDTDVFLGQVHGRHPSRSVGSLESCVGKRNHEWS